MTTNNLYSTIVELTSDIFPNSDKSILSQNFARELGWTPSYNLLPYVEQDVVNIHLIVEHGLENSAVLTFLKVPYDALQESKRKNLLNVSYNNLVDWHIHIDKEKVTYVNNRFNFPNNIVQESSYRNDRFEALRSDAFEKIIGKKISPNIPALDDSLINTISFWKRNISAELDNKVSNEELSSLFNCIIFIRALEDNIRRYFPPENIPQKVLLQACRRMEGKNKFTGIISLAEMMLHQPAIPEYLLNKENLAIFDNLGRNSIYYLIGDFYQNRDSQFYQYDFSIMSKHALSRVYEKYVAILKTEETNQLALFAQLPQEEINKAFGAVYTPQYIARFFGRYLKHNLPPFLFNKIKIAEPAVGSGIFLRSILEIKCDPRLEENTKAKIQEAFNDILGLDVDNNACQAAKLSLALLQLAITNEFSEELNIIQAETISFIEEHAELKNSYDAVVSNPPFISTEILSFEMKQRINRFLGKYSNGRPDSYLAFLKAGIELLKPGGYGLFVLPHSFLISDSGSKLRKYLAESCLIKCLADLSAIPVFGNTGIYVILLIFQKKNPLNLEIVPSTIIKCREFVGKALNDAIQNKIVDNAFYSIYELEQVFFQNDSWTILPFKEQNLREKLSAFPKLNDFLEVRQGFITGADDIFILDKDQIPKGEERIYIPYLPDRKIDRYSIPKSSSQYVFYPFINNKKAEESEIKELFPSTWKYLLANKKLLLSKKSFQSAKEWWRPLRTRQPEHLLISKIVSPHLTVIPKFAIDLTGRFGISRSPFLIPRIQSGSGNEILLYFLGVLNSTPCFWYISNHSHKYSHGYTMLEVKTLEQTPVPDPSTIPILDFKKIVELVFDRINSDPIKGLIIEKEIDNIVSRLYNLSTEDKQVLGIK